MFSLILILQLLTPAVHVVSNEEYCFDVMKQTIEATEPYVLANVHEMIHGETADITPCKEDPDSASCYEDRAEEARIREKQLQKTLELIEKSKECFASRGLTPQ